MRIAFFVANYAPSIGGAQTHVQRVAEGLVARHGHQVEVLTTDALRPPAGPNPGVVPVRHETIADVDVHRAPVARRLHTGLRQLRRAGRRLGVYQPGANTLVETGPLGARLALGAIAAGRRNDVVVGVGAPFTTLKAADVAGRRSGTAFVAMPLLHVASETYRPWVLKSLRRAALCSVNTSFERDWLARQEVALERLAVLPPGCDPDRYDDITSTEARRRLGLDERPTVGFLGRMVTHKGIDTLLAAMESVWSDRPDTQLLLAGERTSWDLDGALARVAPALRERIAVRSPIEDEDKATYLSACDVVAFPSRSESFGMVTIEAWCARRPVVACDLDAVRSVVRPGIDADLVPVGNAVELARALSELLGDEDRCRRYGQAGRARAETEFGWDRIVDRWNEELSRLGPQADGSTAAAGH